MRHEFRMAYLCDNKFGSTKCAEHGQGSSVGIATDYGLGRDFPLSRLALEPT
jgi:hypothetical protein